MIVFRHEPDFSFADEEYEALYSRSDATLFQHPVWLHHLYGSLAPAVGAESLVVSGRAPSSGELLFLLPLVRIGGRFAHRIQFADLGVSDYAAPVVDRDAQAASRLDDARDAIRTSIGTADLVNIDKLVDYPARMGSLVDARSIRKHDYATHTIAVDQSFDAWRKSLPPTFARHLDRKRDRLSRNGREVRMRELDSASDVDDAFTVMREFRQARFADRRAVDLVQDARYLDFYREVARRGALGHGPGSTSVLTVNDETVGVSFCLRDQDRDVFLLIGYDVARFRNYSLGLLMIENLISASFEEGKRVHDLTIGHDGYKADFGATPTPMYSVRAPLTTRGAIAQAVTDQEASARRLAKRALAYQERRLPQLDPIGRLRRLSRPIRSRHSY